MAVSVSFVFFQSDLSFTKGSATVPFVPDSTVCRVGPGLRPIPDRAVAAVGEGPVWATGLEESAGRLVGQVREDPTAEAGVDFRFVTAPLFAEQVEVRVYSTDSRQPLMISRKFGTTRYPVLTPAYPGFSVPSQTTAMSSSNIRVHASSRGCYTLTATWAGGGWTVPFAATE